MMLSPKYIAFIAVGWIVILGWNAFLIQRDSKLFKAYDACIQSTCPQSK